MGMSSYPPLATGSVSTGGTFKGAWTANTSYVQGDYVVYANLIWQANAAVAGAASFPSGSFTAITSAPVNSALTPQLTTTADQAIGQTPSNNPGLGTSLAAKSAIEYEWTLMVTNPGTSADALFIRGNASSSAMLYQALLIAQNVSPSGANTNVPTSMSTLIATSSIAGSAGYAAYLRLRLTNPTTAAISYNLGLTCNGGALQLLAGSELKGRTFALQ